MLEHGKHKSKYKIHSLLFYVYLNNYCHNVTFIAYIIVIICCSPPPLPPSDW